MMHALIRGGMVVEVASATFPVHSDYTWATVPSGQTVDAGYSASESNGSWTFTAPSAAAPTPAQQAQTALSEGLAVTSSSDSSLNATYAVDDRAQRRTQAEMISILDSGNFTNGTTSMVWPDTKNKPHTFSPKQFKELAITIGAYVNKLEAIIDANSGTLPAASAKIS